jgi:hypothetical protein
LILSNLELDFDGRDAATYAPEGSTKPLDTSQDLLEDHQFIHKDPVEKFIRKRRLIFSVEESRLQDLIFEGKPFLSPGLG